MAREADYLFARIDAVRSAAPLGESGDGWQREDHKDLVVEVAEYFRRKLGVPDLERELVAQL